MKSSQLGAPPCGAAAAAAPGGAGAGPAAGLKTPVGAL